MNSAGWRRRAAWCLAGACSIAAAQSALGVGDVVISQVWGGSTSGTGSASLPKSDYVELFNRTANPIDLTGWSVTVSSSGTSTTYAQVNLVGTIQPYSYYLIQCFATPTTNGIDLPTPDVTYGTTTSSLTSTTGKVALRNVTTAVGSVACPTMDATLIDLVTYGTTTTTCREGSANAPAGSSSGSGLADFRRSGGCVDTDQNGADFATAVPAPRNSATASPGACGAIGACCNNNTGVCAPETSAGCGAAGLAYQGDGTTCSPNPCPPSGACCSPSASCTILTAAGCAATAGSSYLGDGATCSTGICGTTSSCCFPDGTCCNFTPTACAALSGINNGAGVTCTAVGNCTTTPANDLCPNAVAVTLGTTYVGNNWSATSTGDGLNTQSETGNAVNKGVWYTFTPAATSVYDVSTCGGSFDNTIQIFTIGNCADLSTWAYVAADDDLCDIVPGPCGASGASTSALVPGLGLLAGQTYHIRITALTTSATGGGNYTLTVTNVGGVYGACCINTTGLCELRTASACTANAPAGTYQGDGTACSPTPCLTPSGACCFTGGVCVIRVATSCTATNAYQGDGTTCGPNPCVLEACCNNTSGACTLRVAGACTTSETGQGPDTVCSPSPCPPQGACCAPCTFSCTTTVETACTNVWHGGTTCSPTNICNTYEPVPGNDLPCNAIALTAGTSVAGVIGNATLTDDGPDSDCELGTGPGVWYTFTPAASSHYSVSTCGSTFDNVLSVLTGTCADPANMVVIACDDDTNCVGGSGEPVVCGTGSSSGLAAAVPFVFLDAGTTYFVRVQAFATTTVGGTFPLLITPVSAGACCTTAGACTIDEAADCTATSEFYAGDNTVCDPFPCPASGTCCNDCTYACTLTFAANCGAGSTFTPGGTSCSPNVCGAGAAPANDSACGAIALTLNTQATGVIINGTSTDDGPAGTCQTSANKGLWYSFSPAVSGDYTISTCGATFDTVLTVFTGDCATPASLVEVYCDDDTCPTGGAAVCGTGTPSSVAALVPIATLAQGTTYYIRVQVFGTGYGGTFPLVVTPAVTGACCGGTGACTIELAALCSGVLCGGTYQGDGTTCSPNPCPPSSIPETCATALPISGHFVGTLDNDCAANENDEPSDTCNLSSAVGIMNSMWFTFTPGASGVLSGTLTDDGYDVTGALYTGTCGAANLTLVCCYDQPEPWDFSTPEAGSAAVSAGVTYYLVIGDWGTGEGGGVTNIDLTIPGPTDGACCAGSNCSVTTPAACVGANTHFAGLGTVCNVPGNYTTPCCKADYNQNGSVTVQDIFDFLGGYFSVNPNADINGSGSVTVQDIFDFLAAYFGGC